MIGYTDNDLLLYKHKDLRKKKIAQRLVTLKHGQLFFLTEVIVLPYFSLNDFGVLQANGSGYLAKSRVAPKLTPRRFNEPA
jgi:hypothetical protein